MEPNPSPFPRRNSPRNNVPRTATVPDVDLFAAADACIPFKKADKRKAGGDALSRRLHAAPKMQADGHPGESEAAPGFERPPSTPKRMKRSKRKSKEANGPAAGPVNDVKTVAEAGASSSKAQAKDGTKKRRVNHLSVLKAEKKVVKRMAERHMRSQGVDLKEFDSLNSSGEIDKILSTAERGRLRHDMHLRNRSTLGRLETKPQLTSQCRLPSRNPLELAQPNFRLLCAEDSTIRRSGGGAGKSSVDPDFKNPLSGVEMQDISPRTMRLRSTSRRQRRNPIAMMEIIDLTVDDDDDVLSVEVPLRPSQPGYLSIPPHMSGPVEVNMPHMLHHPFLDPLLDEEEKLVARLLRVEPETAKLSTNPSSGITLRGHDFAVLRGVEWLNDEVMNSYVALINDREKRYQAAIANGHVTLWRPRSYCFNSFFATRLLGESPKLVYDYRGVSRWTKRAKVDILDLDIVMFPVNVSGNHWVLVVLNIPLKEVYYLDSLQRRDKYKISSFFMRWVRDEIKDKHSPVEAEKFENRKTWTVFPSKYRVHVSPGGEPVKEGLQFALVPQQRDEGSCGVFALKMADCISLGIRSYFQSKNVDLMRRRMALELYQRVLPG